MGDGATRFIFSVLFLFTDKGLSLKVSAFKIVDDPQQPTVIEVSFIHRPCGVCNKEHAQ